MASLILLFPFNVDEIFGKCSEVGDGARGGRCSSVELDTGCLKDTLDRSGWMGESGVDVEEGEVGETRMGEGKSSYPTRTFSLSSFCTATETTVLLLAPLGILRTLRAPYLGTAAFSEDDGFGVGIGGSRLGLWRDIVVVGAVVRNVAVTSEVGSGLGGGLECSCRVFDLLVEVDLGAEVVTMDEIIAVCRLVMLFSICVLVCTPDVDLDAKLMSLWELLLLMRKLELFFFFGKQPVMRLHKLAATSIGNGTCNSMSPMLMTKYPVALTSKS
jgi:hypothetical protein